MAQYDLNEQEENVILQMRKPQTQKIAEARAAQSAAKQARLDAMSDEQKVAYLAEETRIAGLTNIQRQVEIYYNQIMNIQAKLIALQGE